MRIKLNRNANVNRPAELNPTVFEILIVFTKSSHGFNNVLLLIFDKFWSNKVRVKSMLCFIRILTYFLNLVPSASFCYKRKAKKRPWNTSNTWSKFVQIEGIFFRINTSVCSHCSRQLYPWVCIHCESKMEKQDLQPVESWPPSSSSATS